ncbi:MAG TPA: delta-60 repeat domain-containing protein [Gemmataceae bacterium]|nr:delta-60 repeat domain-containing protein [Gemmataceae bacterium]
MAGESRSSSFSTDGDFALARYNPDGSLDAGFDGDGMVTTDFGSNDSAAGLALDGEERIVVVGATARSDTGGDFALARYFGEPVPVVESLDAGSDLRSIIVQLNDDDLDPALATNLANYRVIAANGDADGDGDPFNDDDETVLVIDGITYDAATDRLTIRLVDAVFANLFRVELDGDDASTDGSPGIADLSGRFLRGGAGFQGVLDLQPVTLVQDLLARIESLGLSTASGNSLANHLKAVLHMLGAMAPQQDQLTAHLQAFVAGVRRLSERGEISSGDADGLIADANLILLGLSLTGG